MIPGAQKVDGADIGVSQCGGGGGLGTADDMNEKTVCCKKIPFKYLNIAYLNIMYDFLSATSQPFRVTFLSDTYEVDTAAILEGILFVFLRVAQL